MCLCTAGLTISTVYQQACVNNVNVSNLVAVWKIINFLRFLSQDLICIKYKVKQTNHYHYGRQKNYPLRPHVILLPIHLYSYIKQSYMRAEQLLVPQMELIMGSWGKDLNMR